MVAFPKDLEILRSRDPDERRRLLAEFFGRNEKRLRSMVDLRLDANVRGRIDPSQIIEQARAEASRRIDEYARAPRIPLFLWLHSITAQKLRDVHRHHQADLRSRSRKEICLEFTILPEASSEALEAAFFAKSPSPAPGAAEDAARARVRKAIESMGPLDREILALKHVERLTNAEAALMLGIHEAAAGQRYLRALRSLQQVLSQPKGLT